MNKKIYTTYIAQQRKQYENCVCEWCHKKHDHTYGSGRFCSNSCRMSYIASRNKFSDKHKAHLERLHAIRKSNKIWKCNYCNIEFKSLQELELHRHNHSAEIKAEICRLGHIKAGKTYSENQKTGKTKNAWLGKHHSVEARQKISKKRSEQVVNEFLPKEWVHTKWYKVKNLKNEEFSVRGTWEVNVAKHLNDLGIYWIKAKPIAYKSDIVRHYTPDFYLPQTDEYIEVKGRYTDVDKAKMKLVKEQYPSIRIYFLLQDKYRKFVAGKIQLTDDLLFVNK